MLIEWGGHQHRPIQWGFSPGSSFTLAALMMTASLFPPIVLAILWVLSALFSAGISGTSLLFSRFA
jgi:hypothetical protein